MGLKFTTFLFLIFFYFLPTAESQTLIQSRFDYNSLLKVAVAQNGVYQLKGSQLAQYGWVLPIPSQDISILAPSLNFSSFLNISFNQFPFQDLAVQVLDGGDGLLDADDHIRWYAHAQGGYQWDAPNSAPIFFHHPTDTLQYFYVQQTPRQKNIPNTQFIPNANLIQAVHLTQIIEKDSFNLLSSGRDWWTYFLPKINSNPTIIEWELPQVLEPALPIYIRTRTASRSFGAENIFNFKHAQSTHQFVAQPIGSQSNLFAQINEENFTLESSSSDSKIQLSVESGGINAQAWIDFLSFEIPIASKNLKNRQTFTVNRNGGGSASNLVIPNNSTAYKVWNITDWINPIEHISVDHQISLEQKSPQILHIFDVENIPFPTQIQKVTTKNLFLNLDVNYLIITSKKFLSATERIAQFHEQNGLSTHIVDIEDIYIHFGNHPAALRNFIGYQYYLSPNKLKYVLLVGSGSFDAMNRLKFSTSELPTFQTQNSIDPFASFTSDDYFVSLNPNADLDQGNQLGLQVAIGRIPARNVQDLENYIDKFYEYHQKESSGTWKQNIAIVADNGDNFLHFEDAESVSEIISSKPQVVLDKIYLDDYKSINENGQKSYPTAISDNIRLLNRGVAIWNYSGHGSYSKLADENLLDFEKISLINNRYRLPLVVSATCNFAPFDQMHLNSLGEKMLFQKNTGAMAVLSATRLVFASSNRQMNEAFMAALYDEQMPFEERTVGRSLMRAKNKLYAAGDITNNAKFNLLGDPALQIQIPFTYKKLDSIYKQNVLVDTLKASDEYILKAETPNFINPQVQLSVYTPPKQAAVLEGGGRFYLKSKGILHQDRLSLQGQFYLSKMIVPLDLQYSIQPLKIFSHFISDDKQELWIDTTRWVGGMGEGAIDEQGPQIQLYLNDERFVNGGITNSTPLLIVKLKDSAGINVLGEGLGHDILLTINDDADRVYVLNSYFESTGNGQKTGEIRFSIPFLEPGMHRLKLRAWDVFNQWSEKSLDFQVADQGEFLVKNVLNYPNPFTTNTRFWFEHNRPGEELSVTISIFTVTGKLVKNLRETIITSGTRSDEMQWDGRDTYGNRLGRGVYIYKITIRNRDRQEFMKFEKLFIL